MTDTPVSTTASQSSLRKWRIFDTALLVFIVFNFLFAILASLFATYRVGKEPMNLEIIAVMMLLPSAVGLFIVDLVCLTIRLVRRRATVLSIVALICLGADIFFIWIPVSFGDAFGQRLLAKNGVNQRVAQECLLITQCDLCKTGASVQAYFGMWDSDRGSNKLAQMVQARCPAICSLKPISISCDPERGVNVRLSVVSTISATGSVRKIQTGC